MKTKEQNILCKLRTLEHQVRLIIIDLLLEIQIKGDSMINFDITITFTKIWVAFMSLCIILFVFIYPEYSTVVLPSTVLPLALAIINKQWQDRKKAENEQTSKNNS